MESELGRTAAQAGRRVTSSTRRRKGIAGRSKMSKAQFEHAVDRWHPGDSPEAKWGVSSASMGTPGLWDVMPPLNGK
jgi:hypothetical protein